MSQKEFLSYIIMLIGLIGLGVTLTAYAHTNFTTKDELREIKDAILRIDERVYILVKNQAR